MDYYISILHRGMDFFLRHRVKIISRAHPDVNATGSGSYFPGCKAPGIESDKSLPSRAKVNVWGYTCTPPVRLHSVVLS
jgi:hypothetical protein